MVVAAATFTITRSDGSGRHRYRCWVMLMVTTIIVAIVDAWDGGNTGGDCYCCHRH